MTTAPEEIDDPDESATPTMAEVFRRLVPQFLANVHTAFPVRVESYDAAKQEADVKPVLLHITSIGERLEMPVIPHVPVLCLRGGGFFVSVPVKPGDFGLVVICQGALDHWLRKGGVNVDPQYRRRHYLDDAVFLPVNLYPEAQPLVGAHAENLVVGKDDGAQIHITPDGDVCLGTESPTDFVALAAKTATELNALKATVDALVITFNLHTHLTAVYTAPVAPVPAPTATPLPLGTGHGAVGSVASGNVRSD
jgi:hypothetical protein